MHVWYLFPDAFDPDTEVEDEVKDDAGNVISSTLYPHIRRHATALTLVLNPYSWRLQDATAYFFDPKMAGHHGFDGRNRVYGQMSLPLVVAEVRYLGRNVSLSCDAVFARFCSSYSRLSSE